MNSVEVSYKGFGGLLPALFDQIVDGEPKKTYRLKEGGQITVTLKADASSPYDPKATSCGSLELSFIASYVWRFFKDVKLQEFYEVKDELSNIALKKVFKQIIMGKEKEEHELADLIKVAVTLNAMFHTFRIDVFNPVKETGTSPKKETGFCEFAFEMEEPEGDGSEGHAEGKLVSRTLGKFLSTPHILDYFGKGVDRYCG